MSNDQNQLEQSQRRTIADARRILQPSPVTLRHIPRWLAQRIRARFGTVPRWQMSSPSDHLRRVVAECGGSKGGDWLDHWGSTRIAKGAVAFVSEPYATCSPLEKIQAASEFARRLDLEFSLSPNSHWFPGSTIRFSFTPREASEPGDDTRDGSPVNRVQTAKERRQQSISRQRAKTFLLQLDDGYRPFDQILARIRKRWPSSTASAEFIAELKSLFDREQLERQKWYAERAAYILSREFIANGMTFEELAQNIRRRAPRLHRIPVFMGELRKLFDAKTADDQRAVA